MPSLLVGGRLDGPQGEGRNQSCGVVRICLATGRRVDITGMAPWVDIMSVGRRVNIMSVGRRVEIMSVGRRVDILIVGRRVDTTGMTTTRPVPANASTPLSSQTKIPTPTSTPYFVPIISPRCALPQPHSPQNRDRRLAQRHPREGHDPLRTP